MRFLVFVATLLVAVFPAFAQPGPPEEDAGPDPVIAASYFAEARALADRDRGRLWGVRLDGPMLFVDPATRRAVASQADAEGRLVSRDGVFTGRVDDEVAVANTAVTWSGVRWTMILWPLPADPGRRAELMAHEMFHRVQESLGLPMSNPANAHLDGLDGRYWLQLEWRALRAALDSTGPARAAAVADALAFRRHRRSIAASATEEENGLESNEGVAEYTGVALANAKAEDRRAAAARRLDAAPTRPSLTRSFAYASGPAYGVLLDESDGTWRARIAGTRDLGNLVETALRLTVSQSSLAAMHERAAKYGGVELLASERVRDETRRQRIATDRARFVDGAVLRLPLRGPNVSFDPNALTPLGDAGTVYGTARISDDWGVLEVTGGALLAADWSAVTVAVVRDRDLTADGDSTVTGDGWRLEMAPGWHLVAGSRPGSWKVERRPASGASTRETTRQRSLDRRAPHGEIVPGA